MKNGYFIRGGSHHLKKGTYRTKVNVIAIRNDAYQTVTKMIVMLTIKVKQCIRKVVY